MPLKTRSKSPSTKGATIGKRKPRERKTRVGQSLIRALTEVVDALKSGEPLERRFTVRTVERLPDPGTYRPADVKATRELLGASQPIFALLVGVSLDQVKSWEIGRREPTATVRRLLDEIRRDPARWRQMISPTAAA